MCAVVKNKSNSLVKAIATAGKIIIKNYSIALVCDEYLSLEDYFCIQKFLDNTVSECFVVIKPTNNLFYPNTKGVEWLLKDKIKASQNLIELEEDLKYKNFNTIISINVDIFSFGIANLPAHTQLIYLGNDKNKTSSAANVVINIPTVNQKNGIYINCDFFEEMPFLRNFMLMYDVKKSENLPNSAILEREILFMLLNFYREDLQIELPSREEILKNIQNMCHELSQENLLDIKPGGVLLKKS